MFQEPAIDPYSKPDESSLHPHNTFAGDSFQYYPSKQASLHALRRKLYILRFRNRLNSGISYDLAVRSLIYLWTPALGLNIIPLQTSVLLHTNCKLSTVTIQLTSELLMFSTTRNSVRWHTKSTWNFCRFLDDWR